MEMDKGWTWRKAPSFDLGGGHFPKLPTSPSTLRGEMHPGGVGSVQGTDCNSVSCPTRILAHGGRVPDLQHVPASPRNPTAPSPARRSVLGAVRPHKAAGDSSGWRGTRPCPQQCRMGDLACCTAWDILAMEDRHLPWRGASPCP